MALATKLLTMQEVAQLVKAAGFSGENGVTAIAVIWAESGGNAWAVHVNNSPGKLTDGSLDLGLAQFNTYWLPLQRVGNLMTPEYSVNLMFSLSKGINFGFWSAFVHGYHLKYMDYARAVWSSI